MTDQLAPTQILTVQAVRATANRLLLWVMAGFFALNSLIGVLTGSSLVICTGLSAFAGAVGWMAVRTYREELSGRVTLAAAFAVEIMTVIYAASPLSPEFVQEAHMLYFVIDAFLIFLLCWRSLLIYNVIVVLHHLATTISLPHVAWSGVAPWEGYLHLGVHAAIALVLTPVLMVTASTFERSMLASSDAMRVAQASAATAHEMAEQAERNRLSFVEAQSKSSQFEASVKESQQAVVVSLAHALKALAANDLTVTLDKPFAAQFEPLRLDFNAAVHRLCAALQEVAHSATVIGATASTLASGAGDLSRRTEQQAASVEETAASLAQINTAIAQSSQQAETAGQLVQSARVSAERSSRIVSEAISAMGGIERSSKQIENIISVIDHIAFQTNLLALNAGVEAARAGEGGKGFAVVAREVRELAQRSSQAAREIKDLITKSTAQVAHGVSLVGETGEALEEIVRHVMQIIDNVSGIASSSGDQASRVSSITSTVESIDADTQRNAALVLNSQSATESLSEQVSRLNELIGQFRMRETPSLGRHAA